MMYLILLGVLLAAVGGVYLRGHSVGVDSGIARQQALDRPIIERLQTDKASAVAANQTLAANVEEIRGKANACNATVDALGKVGDAVKVAVNDARRAGEARSRQSEADVAKRLNLAAAAASHTPTQQCEAARGTLQDLSDRMRTSAAAPPESAAAPQPEPQRPVITTPAAPLPSAIRRPK